VWRMKCLESEYERELEMAYLVILRHGIVIVPTNIGYTMLTLLSKETIQKLDSITNTSRDMTYNLTGSESIFKQIFDSEPPNMDSFGQLKDDLSISFVRRYSRNICPILLKRLQEGSAINLNGECTFVLNLGPICEYMFQRFQSDDKDHILIGANCVAKPDTQTYTLDAIDPVLKSNVDFILDIPHWSKPQFDDMGRWLSSPVFDLEELRFRRAGKNMSIAAVVVSIFTLSLFTSIGTEGEGVISWNDFSLYYSKFENSDRVLVTEKKLHNVFKSIDKDGSGSIDINELYEYILHSANKRNAFVFGGDSSTILLVAPPSFERNQVKYHLQSENENEEVDKQTSNSYNLSILDTGLKETDDEFQEQQKIIRNIKKNDKTKEYINDAEKKSSVGKPNCLSHEKFQKVFNNLYQLSVDRQKEGKALRHLAECTSNKRAAERSGDPYTCNQLFYHKRSEHQDGVSDGKENIPCPKISLTQAEHLYERLLQHKKKVEDKTIALRAKQEMSQIKKGCSRDLPLSKPVALKHKN
jgi:Ca2+-binding EF-hand superfamily protein